MRDHVIVIAIGAAGLLACVEQTVAAEGMNHPYRRLASEVQIQQSHGNLPPSAGGEARGRLKYKQTPENGSNPSGAANPSGTASGSPTTPATCNQQNASSPACYSATQQARPVTR
jgi:hypothetical protein